MKPIIALQLGENAAAISSYNLKLELNGCGRGFITAEGEDDYTGQLVRLDLGVNDVTYRWFTGYVERCGPAEIGWKRLFIRELVGGLSAPVPVSLQHPTLSEVCKAVTDLTGLQFALPDAPYVNRKIPHFKSSGTGYQLMEQLASAFNVPDYIWHQFPDGSIFAGSFEHSRFAKTPITIPEEYAKRGSAGNSIDMALIPAIRPGVIFNGRRVTQVEASDGNMTLQWTPLNAKGKPAWESPEKRQIDKSYPELASGLHLPKTARVTGATDTAALGDVSDPFRPRYAVNVQLLNADGSDSDTPEMIGVPLPVPLAGNEGGIYQYPPEGAVVELGFIDGRPDKPQIRQTLQDGASLPEISPGEQLQQFRAGVSQRVTQDGSWKRETDQTISESSMMRTIQTDTETREVISRNTTVKANDRLMVLGTFTLLAGGVVHIADGAWSVAASGKITQQGASRESTITGNDTVTIGGTLTEKITGIRKSIAAAQHLLGASIVIGTEELNLLCLFTDTLDVIEALADATAVHKHTNTGAPLNASDISKAGDSASLLRDKYDQLIG
ncbi:TPA: hypothetical protein QIF36_004175 [Enterobacter kobei]|nr:hypothetical protein [Enterobacter kobei]